MSDYPVTCSKGHRLQNENEAPCPICGDTRRVTHKELRLQSTSSVRVGVTIHRFQTGEEELAAHCCPNRVHSLAAVSDFVSDFVSGFFERAGNKRRRSLTF
jgi:hypothetical protein